MDTLALEMITIGTVVMAITRWRTWHLNMYLNAGLGWAFLATISMAGYSFIDSVALQNMRNGMGAFYNRKYLCRFTK